MNVWPTDLGLICNFPFSGGGWGGGLTRYARSCSQISNRYISEMVKDNPINVTPFRINRVRAIDYKWFGSSTRTYNGDSVLGKDLYYGQWDVVGNDRLPF